MSGNRKYFIVKPINNSPDGFGHHTGLSQIKFSLSNQNKMIEDIKLVGNVLVYKSDGTLHTDDDGKLYHTPMKAGLNALFKTITVSSKVGGKVIERINNVHRLVASLNTMTNTQSDMECDIMEWSLNDSDVGNLMSLCHSNSGVDEGQAFCLNLPVGLFNSGRNVLDLSNNGFMGLNLSLNMNTDATIFSGTDAVAESPYVVVKNIALVGSWFDIDDENNKGKVIPFKSYSSYFNVLNSSNESVSTTLGLNQVTGFMANFQSTANASNYAADCDDLTQLDNLNRVSFAKGGVLRPNTYRVAPVPLPDNAGTSNQVLRQYNSSVRPFNDIKRSNVNLSQRVAPGGENQGVGCRFTTTGGAGESFKQSVFQVNLQSDLGKTGSDPTGMYSFFVSNNMVAVRGGEIEVVN
tara:strand:- start:3880 stop:5100 length:1221 start_codon:yes stop_codon:yes gene_type:complete